jgi:hypothetical protein
MKIEVVLTPLISTPEIKEALKKDIRAKVSPANYGTNYLEKQTEFEELIDSMNFINLIEIIENMEVQS